MWELSFTRATSYRIQETHYKTNRRKGTLWSISRENSSILKQSGTSPRQLEQPYTLVEQSWLEEQIVSSPVDGSHRTQENRPLPPPPPRLRGRGSASQPVRTPPSPRQEGHGSLSQQPAREPPRRSTRKRTGQQCKFKQCTFR